MKLAFFILLSSSAFCAKSKMLDQGKVELKECYPNLVKMFMNFDHDHNKEQATLPDEQTKKICPTLEQTCCPTAGLQAQFTHFQIVINNWSELFEIQKKFLATLKKAGLPHVEDDLSDSKIQAMSDNELWALFFKEAQEWYNINQGLPKELATFYSGFMCNYCHPDTFSSFVKVGNKDSLDSYKFAFDLKSNIPAIIALQSKILNFYLKMATALEAMNLIISKMDDLKPIQMLSSSKIKEIMTLSAECIRENKQYEDMVENFKKCFPLFEDDIRFDIGFMNFSIYHDIFVKMQEIVQNKFGSKVGGAPKKDEKKMETPIPISSIKKESQSEMSMENYLSEMSSGSDYKHGGIFNMPASQEWTKLKLDFQEGGFSLNKHKYNEKLWVFKSTLILSAIASIFTSLIAM